MRRDMILIILVAVMLACLVTAAGVFLSGYITL
jgi:hypothetical protein